jgi:hypothetical protein
MKRRGVVEGTVATARTVGVKPVAGRGHRMYDDRRTIFYVLTLMGIFEMKRHLMAATLLAFAGTTVWADDVVKKPVDAADTPEKLQAVIDSIHAEMAPSKRYEFINPTERRDVDADFATMTALMTNAGSVAAMKQPERIKLFNTQEHVNGILTHTDRNRLICERRSKMGSNLPVTECRTLADVELNRAETRQFVQDRSNDGARVAAQALWQKESAGEGGPGKH